MGERERERERKRGRRGSSLLPLRKEEERRGGSVFPSKGEREGVVLLIALLLPFRKKGKERKMEEGEKRGTNLNSR